MSSGVPPLSTRQILASLGPFVLQAALTVTSALESSRTSRLKQAWLLKSRHGIGSFRAVVSFVPWKTLLLTLAFFVMQMTRALGRTFGFWFFIKFRGPPRSFILISYYGQAILIPFVSFATVSRMARRLNRRAASNSEEIRKTSGVIEPRTVHGQVLKIHFRDAIEKAKLLQELQLRAIEKRSGGLEDYSEVYFSPEAVYAVGTISTKDHSESTTFIKLMGSLRHVKGSQLHRISVQGAILCVVSGLAISAQFRPVNRVPNFSHYTTAFQNCLQLSPSFLAMFYEVFAPSLADETTRVVPAVIVWMIPQISLFFYAGTIMWTGFHFQNQPQLKIILFAPIVSCVIEFLVSEAWIAKAKHESAQFKVPSWADIETSLASPDGMSSDDAEIL